jgi:UDP-N-acetylglucosamine--N-acetylmuramyl-(pentapeptide) pyrophosphoryl-undecaprenol N-acetylglucosamine transferase
VICRSGASSIAELGVIGRPAILVPLPHAIDNDQLRNAESFAKAGGGFVHSQSSLTPVHFSTVLAQLLDKPVALKDAAAKALSHGRPDAARRLADLVITTMAKT